MVSEESEDALGELADSAEVSDTLELLDGDVSESPLVTAEPLDADSKGSVASGGMVTVLPDPFPQMN